MTTPTLREAAQAALDALESLQGGCTDSDDGTVEAITVWCPDVIESLRSALAAQPAPDAGPVAWQVMTGDETMEAFGSKDAAELWCAEQRMRGSPYVFWMQPLYATPIARQAAPAQARQPLTDDEIEYINLGCGDDGIPAMFDCLTFARAIEATHGITAAQKGE